MSSAVYYTSRPLTTFRDIVDDAPETRSRSPVCKNSTGQPAVNG